MLEEMEGDLATAKKDEATAATGFEELSSKIPFIPDLYGAWEGPSSASTGPPVSTSRPNPPGE